MNAVQLETVQISGHSDDIITLEGQIRGELYANYDEPTLVVLSDGTVLQIEYNQDGIWKITTEAVGSDSSIRITPAGEQHDYSDVADVETSELVQWVAKVSEFQHTNGDH
jgi:hypothetical protein